MRTFILLASLSGFAIQHSQCEPIPANKEYINPDFSSSYPKTVQYSCEYRCNAFGEVQLVRAKHISFITGLNAEAKGIACQGVKLEKKPWGYDYAGIKAFYVYDTKLYELRDWARSMSIPLDSPLSKPLMMKLMKNLKSTGESFLLAGKSNTQYSEDFSIAGEELLSILERLPNDTNLLDAWVLRSQSIDTQVFSAEYLIKSFIHGEAYWRY